MTRSKILGIIFPVLFVVGCASGGMKKPTIFVDKPNNIPADIPLQFDSRYERFISGKEMDAFHKLQTDEERQVFIDKFWLERDTDPSTPENEYKQEIDQRIEDIANERFFSTVGTGGGLLFRSNGRFQGDMAHVYLLHGEPDAMDVIEGHTFVPLMLWVYVNPENGQILYAFMFYKKGDSGEFRLFYQDSYKMDQCRAIYEVAALRIYNYAGIGGTCPDDLYEAYNELIRSNGRGGVLGGNIFAWALFNFSSDLKLRLEQALDSPKPASEVAKKSKARVVGEAPELIGKAGTDYVLSSCEVCNSLIPAELHLGEEFGLSGRRSDIDWRVIDEKAEVELKVRVVMESVGNKMPPLVFEKKIPLMDKKDLIISNPASRIFITLLTTDEVAQIPAGSYSVSVYVKNTMTQKYNAWSKEFTK